MFPVYGGKCVFRKEVHNWVNKFSQGRSKSQMMPEQVALFTLRQKQLRSWWKSSFELHRTLRSVEASECNSQWVA
jgi:hypothetical protein